MFELNLTLFPKPNVHLLACGKLFFSFTQLLVLSQQRDPDLRFRNPMVSVRFIDCGGDGSAAHGWLHMGGHSGASINYIRCVFSRMFSLPEPRRSEIFGTNRLRTTVEIHWPVGMGSKSGAVSSGSRSPSLPPLP